MSSDEDRDSDGLTGEDATAEVPEKDTEGRTEAAEAANGSRTLPRWALLGSGAFALAALVVAAVFGVQYLVASHSENLGLADARDQVVQQGGKAIKAFTELDWQHPDDFFDNQLAVADDQMSQQVKQSEVNGRSTIAGSKAKAVTSIQDIAVESLDDHEGKASFLAAVSTTVTQDGQSGVKALRLEVTMTRVGGVWKLSSIDSVPLVGASQ
jgi:Mce-associated membrane protein